MGSHIAALLIACGVRATFPVSIAWGITRLFPRSSAAMRYFTWACAIGIAALLPILVITTPRWNLTTPVSLAQLAPTAHSEEAPLVSSWLAAARGIGQAGVPGPRNNRARRLEAATIVAWIWFLGTAVVACRILVAHLAAWRLCRTARKRGVWWMPDAEQLARGMGFDRALCVESAQVSVPIVLYPWRPMIVMPEAAAQWSWDRIRAVLLHELAHIKRNDLQMQNLAQVACAAYWFNPLLWFAAHQLRLERERACDDCVLISGTSAPDYAAHLYEIARAEADAASAAQAIGLAVHGSQLEQRIVAILNSNVPRHRTTAFVRLMVALPLVFVGLAVGAIQINTRAMEAPGEFQWAAVLRASQTVELHIARGSIRVLRSEDDAVRVDAQTDDPHRGGMQAFATPWGMKFCSVVTTAHGIGNDCEADKETSHDPQVRPRTDVVVRVPAGVHVSGSTISGDVTAEDPAADIDMATLGGNVTLQLAGERGAIFSGNVIGGSIESDFPMEENTPPLPPGVNRASNAPRMVHAEVGTDGPRVTAVVMNGSIRLLRR